MKIEGDYAIIETAEEAAVFKFNYLGGGHILNGAKLPRTLILEAITPKEGDAVFWWEKMWRDGMTPRYCFLNNADFPEISRGWSPCVKANALTIGKTVGELRELLSWARCEA